MTDQRTNPGLWYDAEKRPQPRRSREFIPTRLVAAMFSLAGIALVLASLAVFTGREPTGQPKDAPVWKTQDDDDRRPRQPRQGRRGHGPRASRRRTEASFRSCSTGSSARAIVGRVSAIRR